MKKITLIIALLLGAASARGAGSQAVAVDPITGVVNNTIQTGQAGAGNPLPISLALNQFVQNGMVINFAGVNGTTLTLNGPLVVSASTTLSGGGTMSLGGYTVTFPATGTVAMDAGTLSVSSANNAAGSPHTHLITSSSNPGAAAALLATNSSGQISLVDLLANGGTFNLVNATATTVNFAGAATTLNIGAATGITTVNNATLNLAGTLFGPVTGYNTNIGQLAKKFLTIHAAELWVETLVAQNTLATIGGRILVGATSSLIADLAPGGATVDVKYNNLANGDRVYMEANGKVEFMAVTSGATTITGGYRYSVTRNLDGSGADQWYAGDAVFNTGQTGTGFIDLYSLQGVKSVNEAGPTIVGNVRNSSTYNDWTPRWAIGNLKNLYGISSDVYGAGFGQYGTAGQSWVTIDTQRGIQIGNNTTTLGSWDTSGTVRIGQVDSSHTYLALSAANGIEIGNTGTRFAQWDNSGNITVGEVGASKSNVYITSGGVQLRTNTTVNVQLASTGDVTLGAVATNQANMFWDNTAKQLKFRGSTNGTVVQAYIDTDGSFVAGGGSTVLNASGLALNSDVFASNNSVAWKYTGTLTGEISNRYTSSGVGQDDIKIKSYLPSAKTGGTASVEIDALNDVSLGPIIFMQAFGTTNARASQSYITLNGSGGGFQGVAVGSSSIPTHMLDVYGNGWFRDDTTVGNGGTGNSVKRLIVDGGSGTGAASSAGIVLRNNGTDAAAFGTEIWVTSTGSNTKATLYSSNSTYRLFGMGAGTLSTDASGNITATSDERRKNIDGLFTRGMDDLRGLKPKIGHWKNETGWDTTEQYTWLTAQDLLPHIPEAVHLGNDDFYSVDQGVVIDALVNAVNDLDARLAKMEGKDAPKPDSTDRGKIAADRITLLQEALKLRKAREPKPPPTPKPSPTATIGPTPSVIRKIE